VQRSLSVVRWRADVPAGPMMVSTSAEGHDDVGPEASGGDRTGTSIDGLESVLKESIQAMHEELRHAIERLALARRRSGEGQRSIEANLGEVVLKAQRGADDLTEQARQRAERHVGEAEARLEQLRDESRDLLARVRAAALSTFSEADEAWTRVRADTRARLLGRIQELDRKLGDSGEDDEVNAWGVEGASGMAPEGFQQDLPPEGPPHSPSEPSSESAPVPAAAPATEEGSTDAATLEVVIPQEILDELLRPKDAKVPDRTPLEPKVLNSPSPRSDAPIPSEPRVKWRGVTLREPPPTASPVVEQESSVDAQASGGRSAIACAGKWVRNVGLLVLLFCAYEFWGTALRHDSSQADLRASFDSVGALAGAAPGSSRPAPAPGVPVAVLRIPGIGVEEVVSAGVGRAQLRQGPGHDRRSAVPGDQGNSVIVGHRTIYGGPFAGLGDLRPGSPVLVTTPRASTPLTYLVADEPFTVARDELEPFTGAAGNRLTLVTSHPAYGASAWLVVVAEPQAAPSTPPSAAPTEPGPTTPLETDRRFWLPVPLWSGLLLVVWRMFKRLSQGSHRLAYAVSVPAAVIVLALLFQSIDALLPAAI
jgi:sortase A